MKLLLGKHELASQNLAKKLQHGIFNDMSIINVANFQVLDHSQNYRVFNVRTIVFEMSITVQQLTFFDPPCMFTYGN